MRIISGRFKGKKILQPKDFNTRPLKDLTKESIFNIIVHSNKVNFNLENSNILDLFAGVGSFGIECLSRGASKVTFLEKYKGVLPILKKNLDNLNADINYEIISKDIDDGLIFNNLVKRYDLIFLDPPYKNKNLTKILLNIFDQGILNENGIIVAHRHKKECDKLPDNFSILEEKNYGISKIIFLSLTLS